MKKLAIFLTLSLCLSFNSGCLKMPKIRLFKPGRYLSYQLEPGTRQAEISVSADKLWKAAVQHFRKYQIVESNPETLFISAAHKNIIYEFTAKKRTRKNSAFTLKAYVLDTQEPKTYEARIMAKKIYKKAKSMKFGLENIVLKEDAK